MSEISFKVFAKPRWSMNQVDSSFRGQQFNYWKVGVLIDGEWYFPNKEYKTKSGAHKKKKQLEAKLEGGEKKNV